MAIRSREQALGVARQRTRNTVGTCQAVTRGYFLGPSAGDRDGDGDADAVDGWVSEPTSARHPGDRRPPAGVPLAFSGGSRGFGHRCISETPTVGARSTDMYDGHYQAGTTGNATIEQIESSMGVHYLGWSETITGLPIPFIDPATNKPKTPVHRNSKVARAHRLTERALIRLEAAGKGSSVRARSLRRALKHLPEF